MPPLTDYGPWSAYATGNDAAGVREWVVEFLGDDVAGYNIEALTEACRAFINHALTGDLALEGDQFRGPLPVPPDRARDDIDAAIESVNLLELAALYDQDTPPAVVWVFEDNAGGMYVGGGDEHDDPTIDRYVWALGMVTPDMYGRAASDAQAWHYGEWRPADDVKPALIGGYPPIATWSADGGLVHVRDSNGERVAGAGGSKYLGIEL